MPDNCAVLEKVWDVSFVIKGPIVSPLDDDRVITYEEFAQGPTILFQLAITLTQLSTTIRSLTGGISVTKLTTLHKTYV